MTQAHIDNYCSSCPHPETCGYVTRNMQSDCEAIQVLEQGYDLGYEEAIDKACKWLNENLDDIALRWMRGYKHEDFIDWFKRDMQQ